MRTRNPTNLQRLIDQAEDADLPGDGLAEDLEARDAADHAERDAERRERAL